MNFPVFKCINELVIIYNEYTKELLCSEMFISIIVL
jgi:hypothetical protein